MAGKTPFAVIEENVGAAAYRVDHQIQIPIAVQIGERSAGRIDAGEVQAC